MNVLERFFLNSPNDGKKGRRSDVKTIFFSNVKEPTFLIIVIAIVVNVQFVYTK